eukprot:Opistho-1_new@54578
MPLSKSKKSLLLVDPHSLFRRTVASVARELDLAEVHEASSFEAGQRLLQAQRFDALMLDISDGIHAIALLQSLRAGALPSPAELPVAGTAESCDLATLVMFKELAHVLCVDT